MAADDVIRSSSKVTCNQVKKLGQLKVTKLFTIEGAIVAQCPRRLIQTQKYIIKSINDRK